MKIRNLFLMALAVGVFSPAAVYADDYVDDIYFNPKKDKTVGAKKKNPNYIENFSDMDVDAYNLRGQYYTTPIDTIGAGIGSDQDFVYTQQIQKYYNPTIVLDNSQLLADVLQNSYGNVNIVYNGITPAFFPIYDYGWPYYRGYYNPWSWNINLGGWSIGGWYDPWYWGPSWSWGWGPSWSWGPSWGWGPGWGPAPGWGPGPGWGRPNGTWSPGGNRPLNPGTGWAGNHRPSPNRPMAAPSRPGNSGNNTSSGSQWSIGGNHRGSYGQAGVNSNKQNAPANSSNRGYTIGNDGHRYTGNGNSTVNNSGSGNNRNNSVGNNRSSGNSRGNSYNNSNSNNNRNNSNSNTRNSNSTRNSGSYNSGRSSGNGSFGSGSFGGGHRSSGGGGGGRGGRR